MKILGLNQQGLSTVVAAAAGYRAGSDKDAEAEELRIPRTEVLVEF
jgi:hypothetical protein